MPKLRRLRDAGPAALLAAGWTILLLAWALANPPFAAPDEPAHYLRAVDVGGGHLAGRTEASVPPGLWAAWRHPGDAGCNAFHPEITADCIFDATVSTATERLPTTAGGYEPVAYLLPGIVLRAASDPFTADRLARLAGALPVAALLLLALVLLGVRRGDPASALGPLAAVTPMVLFVGSFVSSSGLEIAAGIAFAAALLRLTREDEAPDGRAWAAAAGTGALLAFTRSTGPIWVALDVLLVAALAGRRTLALVRADRLRAGGTAALLAAAVVANRAWEVAYGSALTQRGDAATGIRPWLENGVAQIPRILDEQVGVFGWLEAALPSPAYVGWQGLLAALGGVALVAGLRRERWAVAASVAAFFAVVVYLSATLEAATRTDVQARHVLALAVVFPLLAGEVVRRRADVLPRAGLSAFAAWAAAGTAVVQFGAFWWNARRHAVGSGGPFLFPGEAQWEPWLGWLPWLALAAAGSALVFLGGLRAARG